MRNGRSSADSAWRGLDLPHDWAIEGPFDPKINPHCGALPFFGVGWYRRHFTLPESARGKFFSIEFDGAMSNSRVWLNGQELGGRPYGYIGFAFDLTPHLRFGGQENVLAVRLAPEDQSSRWYPGAGIYRNVWLDITGAVHVARWGTYITTPEVSGDKAAVSIRTEIQNRRADPAGSHAGDLHPRCRRQGSRQPQRPRPPRLPPAAKETGGQRRSTSPSPSAGISTDPYLYRAVSTLKDGERVLDRYVTPFGIRTIEFDSDQGLLC